MAALVLVSLVSSPVLAIPARSQAQQLRADVIAAEQAEKATAPRSRRADEAEQIVTKVRETFLQPRDGLYPFIDSVYGGGGFTLGAGFLRYYGDRSTFDVHGLYSVKNYKLLEVTTHLPGHLQRAAGAGRPGGLARRDPRRLLRPGHRRRMTTTVRTTGSRRPMSEASATLRPARWAVLAGGVGYEHYDLEPGQGSERPSIETRYTPGDGTRTGRRPQGSCTASSPAASTGAPRRATAAPAAITA